VRENMRSFTRRRSRQNGRREKKLDTKFELKNYGKDADAETVRNAAVFSMIGARP